MTKDNHQQGYIVLITVLILGVATTTIALFLLITGTDASLASSGVEAGVQAKTAADACANLALESIQQNPSLTTPANGGQTLDPVTQTKCTYDITGSSPDYNITATGKVRENSDNVIRRVRVTLDQVSPNLHASSWREVTN